ncbi:MAG: diguanylate cyclase, partial [Chlamydiota bacterium]|nr:diguanylate cyclase [Chlamydiota bacterium]
STKAKMKFPHYGAIILDGYLPDGSGVDLAHWVRKHHGNKIPIAFVSSGFSNAKKFRILKETKLVDFLINKPIPKVELIKLLEKLAHIVTTSSPEKDEAYLDEIKAAYASTIYSKLELLESCAVQIIQSPTPDLINNLRLEIHKLAGSAGSYGYPRVSQACQQMDLKILNIQEKRSYDHENWPKTLKAFLRTVKMAFQFPDTTRLEKTIQKTSTHSGATTQPELYLVDDDKKFLYQCNNFATQQGLSVMTEDNFNNAYNQLSDPQFTPIILAVDTIFPDQVKNGYDLIHRYKVTHPGSTTITCIVSIQGHVHNRIIAVKEGIPLFFEKPISPISFINQLITYIPSHNIQTKFKVLLLSQDTHLSGHISNILRDINIDTCSIQTGENLIHELKDASANMLIIDIVQPEMDGLELLRVIRAAPEFSTLPIIILTDNIEPDLIEKTYRERADDVIIKPIIDSIFQVRIDNFAKRYEMLLSIRDKDPLTDLDNRRSFFDKFELMALRSSRSGKSISLAVIDLDYFKNINDLYGHQTGDQALMRFGSLLKKIFRSTDVCARWGGEEFAILFEDANLIQTQFLMGILLDQIRSEILIPEHPEIKITFSCGIATYPEHGSSLRELSLQADKAMYLAKSLGRNRIASAKHDNRKNTRTDIYLIGKNRRLNTMIRNALSLRGFKTGICSGQKEIKSLLLKKANPNKPQIIIADLSSLGASTQRLILKTSRQNAKPISTLFVVENKAQIKKLSIHKLHQHILMNPLSMDTLMKESIKTLIV